MVDDRITRAVVFDAVGTLLHPEPGVATAYADVGRRHGSTLDAVTIETRFRAAFRKQEAVDRDNGWRTSEDRERLRWRDVITEVFDDLADPRGCFDELFAHFARPEAWRLADGTAATIATLRQRGLIVAMASNFDARLHAIVRPLELDAVIVSSEVGVRKPARAFFDAVVQRLSVPASAIVFVGDDPINDGQGAADVGMRSLLIGRDLRTIAQVTEHPGCLEQPGCGHAE